MEMGQSKQEEEDGGQEDARNVSPPMTMGKPVSQKIEDVHDSVTGKENTQYN